MTGLGGHTASHDYAGCSTWQWDSYTFIDKVQSAVIVTKDLDA
jgi:hypothetical protein